MPELWGKNLLMGDLFHAHWSERYRQKESKQSSPADEKTTFQKRETTTKTSECKNSNGAPQSRFWSLIRDNTVNKDGFFCSFLPWINVSALGFFSFHPCTPASDQHDQNSIKEEALWTVSLFILLLCRSSVMMLVWSFCRNYPVYLRHSLCSSSVIGISFAAAVTTQFPRGEYLTFSNLIINTRDWSPTPPPPYHHAHDLQLLQDKVHLLLRGQRGQDGVVAPAGQLGVVVRVLCRDELQTGVAHQMPTFTAHVFWNGGNRRGGGWYDRCDRVSGWFASWQHLHHQYIRQSFFITKSSGFQTFCFIALKNKSQKSCDEGAAQPSTLNLIYFKCLKRENKPVFHKKLEENLKKQTNNFVWQRCFLFSVIPLIFQPLRIRDPEAQFYFLTSTGTWQWDALLVPELPLTVLVHSAALAAGFLVAHVWGVVLGANFILPNGPLGRGSRK